MNEQQQQPTTAQVSGQGAPAYIYPNLQTTDIYTQDDGRYIKKAHAPCRCPNNNPFEDPFCRSCGGKNYIETKCSTCGAHQKEKKNKTTTYGIIIIAGFAGLAFAISKVYDKLSDINTSIKSIRIR